MEWFDWQLAALLRESEALLQSLEDVPDEAKIVLRCENRMVVILSAAELRAKVIEAQRKLQP